jgi:hypothetical protein
MLIFKMLGEATNNKQINSNEQIRKSIAVCDKLFNNGNNLGLRHRSIDITLIGNITIAKITARTTQMFNYFFDLL